MGGRVMRVLADKQLFMRAFPKAPHCTSAHTKGMISPISLHRILYGHVLKLKLNKARTVPCLIRNSLK